MASVIRRALWSVLDPLIVRLAPSHPITGDCPRSLMLSPKVELRTERGVLFAEFWDCLRLDPTPVKDLLVKYKDAIGQAQRPDLIIDFSGVTFAGSSALSGLVNLQRSCRQHGGRVVLCQLEPTVLEAFRISRLETLFAFADDLDSAFDVLDSRASDSA